MTCFFSNTYKITEDQNTIINQLRTIVTLNNVDMISEKTFVDQVRYALVNYLMAHDPINRIYRTLVTKDNGPQYADEKLGTVGNFETAKSVVNDLLINVTPKTNINITSRAHFLLKQLATQSELLEKMTSTASRQSSKLG